MSYGEPISRNELWSIDETDLLARTIYGEAAGESYRGKVAVAMVIKNRANVGFRGETTIRGVILDEGQFDCINHELMLQPDLSSSAWGDSLQIAIDLDTRDNPIGNRLYYATVDSFTNVHIDENTQMLAGFGPTGAPFYDGIQIDNHIFFTYYGE